MPNFEERLKNMVHKSSLETGCDIGNNEIFPKRMEVWFASLPARESSNVQSGERPVLIISNDVCNDRSPVVTVIPLTTQLKHLHMPTHVVFCPMGCRQSLLLGEQIMALDKGNLIYKMGSVENPKVIAKIEKAVRVQIGINHFCK